MSHIGAYFNPINLIETNRLYFGFLNFINSCLSIDSIRHSICNVDVINHQTKEITMKLNDKYEISPFGNPFDSLFSLLARNDVSSTFKSEPETFSDSGYGKVRFKKEETQLRIEFLVPGWQKSELSLSIDSSKLCLNTNPDKKKDGSALFQLNDLSSEISLPENLATDKAQAKLDAGVLTVLIPYATASKGKNLKIA